MCAAIKLALCCLLAARSPRRQYARRDRRSAGTSSAGRETGFYEVGRCAAAHGVDYAGDERRARSKSARWEQARSEAFKPGHGKLRARTRQPRGAAGAADEARTRDDEGDDGPGGGRKPRVCRVPSGTPRRDSTTRGSPEGPRGQGDPIFLRRVAEGSTSQRNGDAVALKARAFAARDAAAGAADIARRRAKIGSAGREALRWQTAFSALRGTCWTGLMTGRSSTAREHAAGRVPRAGMAPDGRPNPLARGVERCPQARGGAAAYARAEQGIKGQREAGGLPGRSIGVRGG
jgi:hypothetical protein